MNGGKFDMWRALSLQNGRTQSWPENTSPRIDLAGQVTALATAFFVGRVVPVLRADPASVYPRLFKNLAQPSMMAGLDSISTKMYFNPPTFAAAKKSFQSTMPAPMTTSFLWSSGA